MRYQPILSCFSLILLALGASACRDKPTWKSGPDAGSTAIPIASVSSAAPVSSVGAINGQDVTETKDGPWTVRHAGSESGFGTMGGGAGFGSGRGRLGGARPSKAGAPPPAPAPAAEMEESAKSAIAPGGPAGGAPMKAGSTDDNAAFDEFLTFLATWTDRAGMEKRYQPLPVRDRRFIRVVDAKGKPVPAANVRVLGPDRDDAIWKGTTYGDGRTPYYASLAMKGSNGKTASAVEVSYGQHRRTVDFAEGSGELSIQLEDLDGIDKAIQLDVLFIIDTTGSMADEIERVKNTLLRVTERLRALKTDFDLRYGAVLYRDIGDVYLTKTHPFTTEISMFDKALQAVAAGGGGDGPESVNQGLAEAVAMDWRAGAAKVAFLIGDAPPHMDYQGDVPYGDSAVKAVGKGIRVHSVAASGLDPVGTLVFRQTAQLTRGKFIFIEYGSTEESAKSHGVTGPVKSNNLDDIVFEQISNELMNWGKASQ